ncbi:MAG: hypothetical protein WC378_01065 [Opitutaceae bacterium]|jgi:hypothetical protein
MHLPVFEFFSLTKGVKHKLGLPTRVRFNAIDNTSMSEIEEEKKIIPAQLVRGAVEALCRYWRAHHDISFPLEVVPVKKGQHQPKTISDSKKLAAKLRRETRRAKEK